MKVTLKTSRISFLIIAALSLAACSTTDPSAPQLRNILLDEALSFERSLASRGTSAPKEPQHLYTQPVNKTEPCKVLTSKEQLDRRNFRAYWDGQCRDGFAFGLGRDIAISDTHHLEEITVYGENGKLTDIPAITYDFVNNELTYRFIGKKFPSQTIFHEKIRNDPENFSTSYSIVEISEGGDRRAVYWSPFNQRRILVNSVGNVSYKYSEDRFAQNISSTNPVFVAETADSQSGKVGGFTVVRYGNGQIRHFKVGGTQPEAVALPAEYTSRLEAKYMETENTQAESSTKVDLAKRLEREYLYLACNGKHEISGLEKRISTKICTWRAQFQQPFSDAQKKYLDNLERARDQARSQEDQRRAQEQLDYQRRLVQAAERQAGAAENANWQQLLNSNRSRTCYTNFGMTTCY
jgi:hypothetical protein